MKTYRGLFPRFCSFENLYHAYRAARRGKRGNPAVSDFEYDQEGELLRLRDELLADTWRPGRYHNFYVHDPKRRLISAAPFRDRVVHHALVNVLEPIWERRFIHDSYANRVGKGTHRALQRCRQFARRWRYVLQSDVQQFFPAIDHGLLRAEIARLIRDDAVLNMVDRILASGADVRTDQYEMQWFPGDDLLAAVRPRGLPIGNLTSQFWANVYLNGFDHVVKRDLQCQGYVRYVDDFLLFSDEKAELHRWRDAVIERLACLRLRVHEGRAQVFPVTTGIPFLGFRVYPTHLRLKRRTGMRFERRLRELREDAAGPEVDVRRVGATVRSWLSHASHGATYGLRRAVLQRAGLLA